jgi:hypothetical protein
VHIDDTGEGTFSLRRIDNGGRVDAGTGLIRNSAQSNSLVRKGSDYFQIKGEGFIVFDTQTVPKFFTQVFSVTCPVIGKC